MNKPKKPLRGLFASTEAPVTTPTKVPVRPPVPRQEPTQPPRSPIKPKVPAERLAPPPRVKQPTPAFIMEEAPSAPQPPSTQVVSSPELVPHVERAVAVQDQRIMAIQYNFDAMRTVREEWLQRDYVEFLKKLDQLQTEAFLLRGKLLGEAKSRFFEENKTGWAEFCESSLGMNYTTANQYIRVATEFDVTSHQRTDFGFEHFKALLPLSPEQRSPFLNGHESWSVKSIRVRVKQIISSQDDVKPIHTTKEIHRQSVRFIRQLQQMKTEMTGLAEQFVQLPQTQRWQISAACQNISSLLNQMSRMLNDEVEHEHSLRNGFSRAGAFATAQGVASMNETTPVVELTDPSHSS